jgi:phosphomannomutase
MILNESVFGAYDIRGVFPDKIDIEGFVRIARAFCSVNELKSLAVGRDVRDSGEEILPAVIAGLTALGIEVIDIGIISTDMLYFAAGTMEVDGGLSITASHNPKEYNGLKLILKGAAPMSDAQYAAVKSASLGAPIPDSDEKGSVTKEEILEPYLAHVLSFISPKKIKPLRIAVNCNYGAVSRPLKVLAERLNLDITYLGGDFDGGFPKGRPDPMIPANRTELEGLLKEGGYDLGASWDADADRCFFFTKEGEFIQGCFTNALLAEIFLSPKPGQVVIADLRCYWMIEEAVRRGKGRLALSKSGHIFIKEAMRREKAVFGGELSGHTYYKKNFYADNGLIPFLLVLQQLSVSGKTLEQLLRPYTMRYFVSGERNFTVRDAEFLLRKVADRYPTAERNELDGLSLSFPPSWRMNLRVSNTEPLVRLNVESTDRRTLQERTDELVKLINTYKE